MQVYLLLDIALMQPEAKLKGVRHFLPPKIGNKYKAYIALNELKHQKACKHFFEAYLLIF